MKLRGSYTLRPEDSHENWPHTLPLDGRMDVSISGVHGTLGGRREGGDMVGKVGAWHPLLAHPCLAGRRGHSSQPLGFNYQPDLRPR